MNKTIARFSRRNPRKQAIYIVRRALALKIPKSMREDDGRIYSTGTAECYRSALTTFCKWLQKEQLGDLRGVNAMTVARYLEHRQPLAGQKTLDLDRQAAQFLLRQNYGQKVQLSRIQSNTVYMQTRKTTLRGKPSIFSGASRNDCSQSARQQFACGSNRSCNWSASARTADITPCGACAGEHSETMVRSAIFESYRSAIYGSRQRRSKA